jgi:hypothetical protein
MGVFSQLSLFSLVSASLLAYTLTNSAPVCAQRPLQSSTEPPIHGPIDESSLVTLRGNTHPLAQPKYDRGLAPVSMPASRMLLILSRSTQQEAELQSYLQSVQDANSPNYRKYLSPEEFGQRFGIGDADLQTIQSWLAGHGFSVSKVGKGRMTIEFSGTVGQVQTAFHTSLHSYLVKGEQHWANASDPQIPSALGPVVAGLGSLNSFRPKTNYVLGPRGVMDAQRQMVVPAYTNTDAYGDYYLYLSPADAATIYNTPTTLNANLSGPTYDGTGVTIGVAGDSNINLAENANYRSTFGLTANPTTVVVDGDDPGENGDAIEAYLDTQVSGGVAPGASVVLYTAADTDLQQGLNLAIERAIDDNAVDILNVSFGECEQALGASGNQFILNMWEQAAAQGISVTVSAGDSGSAGCDADNKIVASQGLAVNGISSTPYNVSVGGTDFDVLYSNFPSSFAVYVNVNNSLPNHRSALGYIPEEPWNDSTYPNSTVSLNEPLSAETQNSSDDDIVAGGGGISSTYPIPNWQGSFASGSGRNLPDLSLLAGNGFYGALWSICTDSSPAGYADCISDSTSGDLYLTGVGGTSASAPAFAGMLALVKQKTGARLGQADYGLYNLAGTKYSTVFHDVTTGDNSVDCTSGSPGCIFSSGYYTFMSGYNATTGYDLASGLGSVNAGQLVQDWPSPSFTSTTTSLQLNGAASPIDITHGQSVAVNASVTGDGGTPAGLVGLVDNESPAANPNEEGIAEFTLANGSVAGTTDSLPGGSYQISAHYGGSSTFAQSISNAISVTVSPESSTTTLKVVGYSDPATGQAATTPYYGFDYVMDAQPYGNSASAAKPNGPATGAITFTSGGAALGSAILNSEGIAELKTALVPGGADNLAASFPGDASFLGSTSPVTPFTVVPAVTSVEVLSSPSDPALQDPITLTAMFIHLDSDGAAPTGTVTFTDIDDSTTVGTAPVTGTPGVPSSVRATASAVLTTSTLSRGNHDIAATYGGDSNYGASAMSASSFVVVRGATTNIGEVLSASTIKLNQSLQVTVNLPRSGTLPVPTGTVIVAVVDWAGYPVYAAPAAPVVNGSVTVTIPANSLELGALTVGGTYSGDATYYGAATSSPVQVNSSGSIAPTVALTLITGALNAVTANVTVTGPSGDPVPTGSFTISGIGESFPLTNGSATLNYFAGLNPGANILTVTYLGDTNYTPGSASGTVFILAGSTLTIVSSSTTLNSNQPYNVTVTVDPYPGIPAPSGTVTLSSGSYTSSPATVTGGSASLTIPANSLPVGTDLLTATYSGDANYLPATRVEFLIVDAVPTFSITPTSTVTVAPGAITGNTSTVTVTPAGGFTGSVGLTAALTSSPSGAQDLPTLSFGATTPVSITDTSAGTATLTISTTAATTSALDYPRRPGLFRYAAGGSALACILLVLMPTRGRNWRRTLGMLLLLVGVTGGVFACSSGVDSSGGNSGGGGGGGGGGTSNPGTTAGSYTITVTATSGSISQTGTVTLTVQ